MPSEWMKEMARWVFWLIPILSIWFAFWPRQSVALIAGLFAPFAGDRPVPKFVVPVFRVVGILGLISVVWKVIDFWRVAHP
jgi:hypothetical protein